jgi:hypothetical protein
MEDNNIEAALFELLSRTNEMYGDAVEKIWFYDGELCPFCQKRKIDSLKIGEDLTLSLNAFMYRDMSTLIGYFLCSQCITDLLGSTVNQKILYDNLELKLKDAYHDHLKSQAS